MIRTRPSRRDVTSLAGARPFLGSRARIARHSGLGYSGPRAIRGAVLEVPLIRHHPAGHHYVTYDSTMFVALHGAMAMHPWREPESAASDAYSLFVARSSALGLLADAGGRHEGGLWGMNDAGHGNDAGSTPPRVGWFQVSLPTAVPAAHPLPVQAFLACAGDVMDRIGTWRLDALQLLLPGQSLDRSAGVSSRISAVMSLLQDAGWFADRDPSKQVDVQVSLDGGQDPTVCSVASDMRAWTQELKQDVFRCASVVRSDRDRNLVAPVSDEVWPGPPQHRTTFEGTLAEWSLDGLGWLTSLLVEAACAHGVNTPFVLSAVPSRLVMGRTRRTPADYPTGS